MMNKILLIACLFGIAIPIVVVNGDPLFKVFAQGTPIYRGRADTILSQGGISQHVHRVYGSSGFSQGVRGRTVEEEYYAIFNGTCTTSSITVDKSAYWIPDVYYSWPNGTFSLVPNGGLTVYYFGRSGDGAQENPDYQAFPIGFRMLAGNAARRNYDGSIPDQAMTFACLTAGPGPAETPYFPTANYTCVNGLRTQVFFPQCWDGVNLDSPDHQSHVSYPDQFNTGNCPSTHPVRLPAIFFEVLFDVNPTIYPHGQGVQPFVLAPGDPTGYGLHGDFLNGWDVNILHAAMHDPSCESTNTNNGNDPQNCLPLQPYIKANNPDQSCLLDNPILNYEDLGINHWISHLPGNNPIQPGPLNAVLATGSYAQTIANGTYRVLLKSVKNGLYVSSLQESTNLIANVSEANVWYPEVFEFIPLGGGLFGIQTESTSHWVSSNNGGSPLTGDRRSPSGWESWTIVYSGGSAPSQSGTIGSLLSQQNKYVTVDANSELIASASTITVNEQFWIIDANAGVPDTRP